MPRPCQRVRLESGLKPNINSLIERSLIEPGAVTGPRAIGWPNKYSGEQIAAATITADIHGTDEGWLHISSWKQGGFDQRLFLSARPRHFGGLQWFFCLPLHGPPCHGPLEPSWRPNFRLSGTVGAFNVW